jgi:hypothetical protein
MSIWEMKDNILVRTSLPGSSRQLALIRILIGLQIVYSASSHLLPLLKVVDGTKGTKTIFPDFLLALIADLAVPYLQWTVVILAAFLTIGLLTRYILPFLFVSFILLFGYWYSKFDAPVPWLYLWFPLLILCFSDSSASWSIDRLLVKNKNSEVSLSNYRWPIEIFSAWFAYIYFAAGLAKIFPLYKGLNWLSGGTSQLIIYERYLDSALHYLLGYPFFDYSRNYWVFSTLSLGSLLIELSCVLILFTRKFNYIILFLVLSMHFFLYLTGVPGFMQLSLILGIALINPKVFEK